MLKILVFLLISFSPVLNANQIKSIFINSQSNNTTLDIILTNKPTTKIFTLQNPHRIVLDFNQTTLKTDIHKINYNKQKIKTIRTGNPNPSTLRIVLDMPQLTTITTKTEFSRNNQYHIHLLLTPKQQIDSISKKISYPTTTKIQHLPYRPLRDVIVVIDPGHGGKDPGAKGPSKKLEKDVVLAISMKLKQLINQQPGMHAILTRQGDYYIGLRERLRIARKNNADIFIAVHADAFIHQHSHGASVFALSPTGATSEAARWLAEKENYSELGGVNLSGLDDRSGVIRSVLIDLSQTATINASLNMGSSILYDLGKMTSLHNAKVEQARFVVLKSPDIPSVLIETGFISNPREELNLNNQRYQARIASAIFNGVKRYFIAHPLQGTRLELVNRRKSSLTL